jgi:hypothetical protein
MYYYTLTYLLTYLLLLLQEGQGRQNRKLAVAHHKRRTARSHFTVAQNVKGLLSNSDNTFLGTVTANLTGSKYHIWDQVLVVVGTFLIICSIYTQ